MISRFARLPLGLSCSRRSYFTNAELLKREDPYHQLGLQWGATHEEIRSAYRRLAVQYHPDRHQTLTEQEKQKRSAQFLKIQRAYEILTGKENDSEHQQKNWSLSLWRKGDKIALNRTDVAGKVRQRPKPPATASQLQLYGLGHPSGQGRVATNEYLTDGTQTTANNGKRSIRVSSSVGSGQSKWVKPKPFVPWSGKAKVISANNQNNKQSKS